MNIDRAAGALLVGLPITFNLFFFLLGRFFDYPGILRSPVGTILSRFQAGGLRLKLLWYGFMLTALLLAPLAVLLGQVLGRDELELVPVATTVGVLAAAVQFLGLARWPFLVPALARTYEDPNSSPGTREATAVVFNSFHRYLGVAVGECLGYLFTGLDAARRQRHAPVVLVRRLAGLARHRRRRLAVVGSSSSSAASKSRAGSSPGRSCRLPTPPGRSGSSPPDSCCSLNKASGASGFLPAWRHGRSRAKKGAAGIEPLRRIYDLRHTFATFVLRADISTFDLSRYIGAI